MIFRVQYVNRRRKRASHRRDWVMMTVRRKPGFHKGQIGLLLCQGKSFVCTLGQNGITHLKKEGDGCTPAGQLKIVDGFYRKDRMPIFTVPYPLAKTCSLLALNPHSDRKQYGWCDAPNHSSYNHKVTLPFTGSHETLCRNDHLYDLVFVLDWNLSARSRNRGSAIFLHVMPDHNNGTQGCIGLSKRDLVRLSSIFKRAVTIKIV